MEEFKKIVALVFVEGHKRYPYTTNKTALARKISEEITLKEEGIPDNKHYKTFVNYYDHFFHSKKKLKPSENTIRKLLSFLNYDSLEHFINNQPISLEYLDQIPFLEKKVEKIELPKMDVESNQINEIQTKKYLLKEVFFLNQSVRRWKKNTIAILTLFMVAIGAYIIKNESSKECLFWDNNQYRAVDCDQISTKMPTDMNYIGRFEPVKLDSTIQLFDKNGEAMYLYGKKEGNMNLFTIPTKLLGNNKTLFPIPPIIVRKFIYQESTLKQ